jgi:hypothetical protein
MNVKSTKDILPKKDEYVLVSKDKINKLFQSKQDDDAKLEQVSKIVSAPSLSSTLPVQLPPSNDESEYIRQLYLARLSSAQGRLNNVKHFHTDFSQVIATPTTSFLLNDIPQGNGQEQRLGARVKLKHLICRIMLSRSANNANNVYSEYPLIQMGLYREKIPAAPGTAPPVIGTDANPPASATLLYSRLGNAATSFNTVAVRNPLTASMYHIYKREIVDLRSPDVFIDFANNRSLFTPKRQYYEWVIKMDDYVDFAPANSSPITNALFFWIQSDTPYTGNFVDTAWLTFDLIFEDTQVQ